MSNSGSERIHFEQCIIAAGSEAIRLPGLPAHPSIMDSTDALELPEFSGGLLVIGGGIIGWRWRALRGVGKPRERGGAHAAAHARLRSGPRAAARAAHPLALRADLLATKVGRVEPLSEGLRVTFEGEKAPAAQVFDRVLVAVGRVPNGKAIGADMAGVTVSEHGFIPVDKQMRTNVPHIFAVGTSPVRRCSRTRQCTKRRLPPRWPPATGVLSMHA